MTEKQHVEERLGKYLNLTSKLIIWPTLWVFYFAIMLNVSYMFGLVQATIFVLAQFWIVQINVKKLLPFYYDEGKTRKHFTTGLLLILGFSVLSTVLDWFLVKQFIHPPKHEDSNSLASVLFPLFMHFMINGFAFFVSTSLTLNEKAQGNLLRIKELERAQTDTELRFLKTQINPHFLFNALNNIYTISYMGDQQAPEKILELSEMLRYVLYDCKGDSVPIEKEIAYIRNYIDFQQLKTEEKQKIELKTEGVLPNTPIAPMLLIPFVENSFKHSKIDKDKDAFVEISICQRENLEISFRNSIPAVKPTQWLNSEGGIGLENVRKRLELLYPGKFVLKIDQEDGVFRVKLTINK